MISNRMKHHRYSTATMLIHALAAVMPAPLPSDIWCGAVHRASYPIDTGQRSGVRAAQREAVRRRNRRRHNRRAKRRRSDKNPVS